ncbi:hypothetical protein DPMN_098186 [Dreissena polymorpha]|uniref:Uncharacterized protein n=1 Tax=Dreissena polymorpha TaxID=45954 RepID=A0A9D4R589_DREPO|nr:hypothetical protein DPMN_098186 [Dreissena polymorpha]
MGDSAEEDVEKDVPAERPVTGPAKDRPAAGVTWSRTGRESRGKPNFLHSDLT